MDELYQIMVSMMAYACEELEYNLENNYDYLSDDFEIDSQKLEIWKKVLFQIERGGQNDL